jgi:hypothetical protein
MAVRTSKLAGRNMAWRRAVTGTAASAALAAGMLIGAGSAHADVLDDIYATYDTGQGGGQVSNLIHTAMKLRAAGFVPSKGDITDLEAAMEKRPNQTPLIAALESTVSYQQRSQARRASQGTPAINPATIGTNPLGGPGQIFDPNTAPNINVPLG